MSHPLVSIITPSFNQGRFIEETIQSVLGQSYPHIEYILLDGGSTDHTSQVLAHYQDAFTHLICEPDAGQANALNRGFALATGDLITWLNADDVLLPDAIERVVNYFRTHPAAHFVYGDAIATDITGQTYGRRVNVAPCDFHHLVTTGDFIVQPSAFWRRSVLERIGPLDDTLTYTLDYEYWMRIAQQFSLHYVPEPLSRERLYGGTKTSRGGLARIQEIALVAQRYGGEDVPRMFRPEAAANYARAAVGALVRGHLGAATADIQRAAKLNNHTVKFLLHFIVLMLWGGSGTIRLRLWSNWIRNVTPPITLPRRVPTRARQPMP